MKRKEAKRLFSEALPFHAGELSWKIWAVEMVWGLPPDMSMYGHRKVIRNVTGYNILEAGEQWGQFIIRQGDGTSILFDYSGSPIWIYRRIRDYVRYSPELRCYIGEFRVHIPWHDVLLGYFTLRRTKKAGDLVMKEDVDEIMVHAKIRLKNMLDERPKSAEVIKQNLLFVPGQTPVC